MKHHSLRAAAAALALALALAGCGGGDPGSGASSPSGTLAEGSDPLVNGASSALAQEEEPLHMMTIEETIEYFKSLDPAVLGLEGESMEAYHIYPSEKAIPVDNLPCMKLTVYASTEAGTNSPEETFLVARDGTAVYRLVDGEAEQIDLG